MFKDITLQNECKRVIKSKAFEILVEGVVRSGKTFAILIKMHMLMSKYPNSRALILRKTKSSLAQSILQTFEDEVLGHEHYLLRDAPRRENRQSYRYKNGSEIVVAGLDNPGKIMSSEYDFVYIAEATEINEDDLQHIITRMSCDHFKDENGDSWQQIIMDCNPVYPHHFINQRFLKQNKKRERIFISHKCNPKMWHTGNSKNDAHWTTFGEKYIANLTESLSGVQKKRLLEGLWVMGDKLVYPEFRPDKHKKFECPMPCEATWVGVDFGWNAGAAIVVNVYKDIFYVVETHIYAEKQISEWIDILKDIRTRYSTQFNIVADSAEPRSIEQMKNAGLPVVGVKKGADSISIGVDLIKTRLKNDGLYILEDAQKSFCHILQDKKIPSNLVDEIYCYELDTNTDKPISKHNHICDSLRYIALTVDQTPNFEFVISGDDDFEEDMWRSL